MEEEFKNLCLNSVEVAEKIRHIAASEFKLNLNMTQTQKLIYISYGIELARKKRVSQMSIPAHGPLALYSQEYTGKLIFPVLRQILKVFRMI